MNLGVAAAIASMVSWGIGDFLIQRSARSLGDWKTLFYIGLIGNAGLLPFCYKGLSSLGAGDLLVLVAIGAFSAFAAVIDFEALKKGKLAIVEPIFCLEIPVAALLAFFMLGERISFLQMALVAGLVVSLVLVSLSKLEFVHRKMLLERGVRLTVLAAISMGVLNFAFGVGAREVSPILATFVIHSIAAIVSLFVLVARRQFWPGRILSEARQAFPMAIADTVAWASFAYALTKTPIAIATAFSESYIVIAVLLGIFVNRERLKRYQYVGIFGSIVCGIFLATTL
ncbi:MAG: DMT family transporter [Candidatus Taylorbacteria bacterium]|nr:DMT family transporter [Candidatus Taylorbacteria bacterium]